MWIIDRTKQIRYKDEKEGGSENLLKWTLTYWWNEGHSDASKPVPKYQMLIYIN